MPDDSALVIRPSMLPKWTDCPRRSAVKAWPELFIDRTGITPRSSPKHIGASVGTGFHAGGDALLRHKMEHGYLCTQAEARDAALESLAAELNGETFWDDETPNQSTAERQIERMLIRYRTDVAQDLNPVAVEQRFEGNVNGIAVSGKMDSVTVCPGEVHDNKTGKRRGANAAQYGIYLALAEAHGVIAKAERAVEDFVQRVDIRKDQPPVAQIRYPADYCKKLAANIIRQLSREMDDFFRTGDVEVLPANPSSGLCTNRFCPAHSTKLCKHWISQ